MGSPKAFKERCAGDIHLALISLYIPPTHTLTHTDINSLKLPLSPTPTIPGEKDASEEALTQIKVDELE